MNNLDNLFDIKMKLLFRNIIVFFLITFFIAVYFFVANAIDDIKFDSEPIIKIILPFMAVAFSLVVIVQYFMIRKFRLQILDNGLNISQGVIVNKKSVLNYSEITKVIIKNDHIDKLLGLASVLIETNTFNAHKGFWSKERSGASVRDSYSMALGLNIGLNRSFIFIPGLSTADANFVKELIEARISRS